MDVKQAELGTPIKVCILTSAHKPFTGRIFHHQAVSLAKAGYEVKLIAPADFEHRDRDGVTVLGVPPVTKRLGRPLIWYRLYRYVRCIRPDVIHFHDPELLLLVPLFRLLLGQRVRIIYDVHEYFVDAIANKYWIPRWLRPVVMAMVSWSEKLLIRGVDGIVCAVEGQKPLYDGFRGSITVVRNLPLAALFKKAEPHPALDVDGYKLIYAGLILPKRGVDVILETMRILQQRGIEDIKLFLLGPNTSPAYIQKIETFVREHQLTEQVQWLGYVPHHKVKHYLKNADVGLVPGLHLRQYSNPGLTTKLFEYMLCALPVVSADYPHRRIYVEEGNCGLVVPAEDAGAHADAILWLRDHPEEARAMGKSGRDMVLARYTWEKEQLRLLDFYQSLLHKVKA
jgi:glycosyltransferase involved in cell wall biosynthesis